MDLVAKLSPLSQEVTNNIGDIASDSLKSPVSFFNVAIEYFKKILYGTHIDANLARI